MDTKKAFEEMIQRLKEKRFDPSSAMNIAIRLITDERAEEMLRYMDRNPEADEYELADEANRIQKKYPRPQRRIE